MVTVGPILQTLRLSTLISLSLNAAAAILGGALSGSMLGQCGQRELLSAAGAAAAASAKVVCMIGAGITQGVVASTIATRSVGGPFDADRDFHLVARTRYRRWLWWTRLGIAITILQFAMAIYLLLVVANDLSSDASHKSCFPGKSWRRKAIVAFLIITWVVVIMQCIGGSEVLRWRSFYSSHDIAWQVHYREVFDHGIREVMCCLGRVKYLSVLEDDEVYMVARMLGDLMAYRASGTGHLELLAGDNCWRGHAAAFLKYVNLPPDTLHKGRVSQRKREAAYFVVLLHDIKTVVITVRGTETPEDLITDGLCGECSLTMDDLDGFINSKNLDPFMREKLLSSFPHFGHSGIIKSARELYTQIDGKLSDEDKSDSKIGGCLSSLLGEGCKCEGYKIRIVGHSLGGSVAAILGIMLYGRYPNIHVYSYGPLPCLDPILAEACSEFITSTVYNDEFSARLSMNSIVRLRAAAVKALLNKNSANISLLPNLFKRIAHITKDNTNSSQNQSITVSENSNAQSHTRHLAYTIRGGAFLCGHAMSCVIPNDSNQHRSSDIENSNNGERLECSSNSLEDAEASIVNQSGTQFAEVYLPGLVVHLVRMRRDGNNDSILRRLNPVISRGHSEYKAFVVNRERFTDIVVSPYMFLDHLPWRCRYALQRVLESQELRQEHPPDFLSEEMNV